MDHSAVETIEVQNFASEVVKFEQTLIEVQNFASEVEKFEQSLPQKTSNFAPGDLVRKVKGTTKYFVINTNGNWISVGKNDNWQHESRFVLLKDGREFRKELRKKLESYLEQCKQKASEKTGPPQSEVEGTQVAHEGTPEVSPA